MMSFFYFFIAFSIFSLSLNCFTILLCSSILCLYYLCSFIVYMCINYFHYQPTFAFEDPTRKSGQVTWTVLLQGFRDSPHLFGLALTQDLSEWQYPQATLLQYGDDLLLCGPAKPVISWATESLLNFLADRGYKIYKEKAQLCQSRVTYLGLVLEKEMRALEKIESVWSWCFLWLRF
jgi:hypothetical protein